MRLRTSSAATICSRAGRPWGSALGVGNVYHEGPDGTPHFDFYVLDRAYDAIVGAAHTDRRVRLHARDLVPAEAPSRFAFQPGSPTQYSEYEAGCGPSPQKPVSLAELIGATVAHCASRYGRSRVSDWRGGLERA